MIGWGDIYKVVGAMVPLYIPLILGYCSIKWWHMFTLEHVNAINTLNFYFIMPFFTFEFLVHLNPYKMNFLFVAADVIAKSLIVIVLAFWANCTRKGGYDWSITTFSISTLNNTLVVGVPLMTAMYGKLGEDLVVQSFALQGILWIMILLFMLEFRRTRMDYGCNNDNNNNNNLSDNGGVEMNDLEGNGSNTNAVVKRKNPSFWVLLMIVGKRLILNPNYYANILGLAWAFISCRWHVKLPSIVEGSILIMSKAGSCAAMFCIGLFMALQEKIISCGFGLTIYGMALRFIVGPATLAIGCAIVGLRGDVLRIAVIQAALPQGVAGFTFAKEYNLHANMLSTAVIFGTIVSLPILIAYYAVLQALH